jgi:endonuclease/exonuclease/phosphatase family metal-dependent hydrolase
MPCAFMQMRVMTVHAALALQQVQTLAGPLPYVLAGDFNFKPTDATYAMYHTGSMPRDHPDYPSDLPAADKWTPDLDHPVQSAYAAVLGAEPEATNYALSGRNKETFHGTLDYIYFRGLRPVSVLPLPTLDELRAAGKSLPNSTQPSDHLKIGATFALD